MKRNIVLLASLFFATVAMAQQPNAPKPPSVEDRLKHFTENLDKEMTLSNEQKQKVLAAYKVFFGKMEEFRAKNPPPPPPPPPPAIKEEMDKLVADRDSKLQAVLSAEQFKTLKEMEKKRHMGHHHEMPPPPPLAP